MGAKTLSSMSITNSLDPTIMISNYLQLCLDTLSAIAIGTYMVRVVNRSNVRAGGTINISVAMRYI